MYKSIIVCITFYIIYKGILINLEYIILLFYNKIIILLYKGILRNME